MSLQVNGTYAELIASVTPNKTCGILNPATEVPYRMRFSRGVAKAMYVLLRRANIQVSYDAIRTECEIHCGQYKDGLGSDQVVSGLLAPVAAKFHVVFAKTTYDNVKKQILSRPVCESTFVAELALSDDKLKEFAKSYLANEVITAAQLAVPEGQAVLNQYVTVKGISDDHLEVNTSWSCSQSGSTAAIFAQDLASSLSFLSIKLADGAKARFGAKPKPDDFFTGIQKLSKDDELTFDNKGQPLGVGSFGTVFKGSLKHHKQIAVKVVDTSKVDSEILLHELAFPCSAPNIVHSFGYAMELNPETKKVEIAVAMEALGCTLTPVLEQIAGKPFRSELHLELAKDILFGVAQLAEADLVHRDLKPGNFLFGMTGLKIADLGSASAAGMHRKGSKITSAGYLPPEAIGNSGINTSKASGAWDMFSAGVLIRRLVTGETIEEIDAIRAKEPNFALPPPMKVPTEGDKEAAALALEIAEAATHENPDKRISAKDALAKLNKKAKN